MKMAFSKGSGGPGKHGEAIVKGAEEGMRACHSKVLRDRIQRSKQDSGEDAGHVDCMAAFRLLEEGHSLHPRIRTSIHELARLPLAVRQKTANESGLTRWISLKSKVVERFLHSETANSAVPPVGMTSYWSLFGAK